jgi:hypothetical protein
MGRANRARWGQGAVNSRGKRQTNVHESAEKRRDMCCLLVLDSVTSTPQWIRQPRPRVYLKEGTYHTRLFRGPNTNDMKK